jgi:hypothetical protein
MDKTTKLIRWQRITIGVMALAMVCIGIFARSSFVAFQKESEEREKLLRQYMVDSDTSHRQVADLLSSREAELIAHDSYYPLWKCAIATEQELRAQGDRDRHKIYDQKQEIAAYRYKYGPIDWPNNEIDQGTLYTLLREGKPRQSTVPTIDAFPFEEITAPKN